METQYKREFAQITLKDFLFKTKPAKCQTEDSEVQLLKGQVEYLKKDGLVLKTLASPTNPIVLTQNWEIIQGNHRHAAAMELYKEKLINPDFKFEVIVLKDELSKFEKTVLVVAGNGLNSKRNKKALRVLGHTPITTKVTQPLYKALKNANDGLPNERIKHFALLLAGIFNNNPALVDSIKRGNSINTTGSDIYTARSYTESKENFFDAVPKVDLRDNNFLGYLTVMLKPTLKFICTLKRTGKWEASLGKNKNFEYILLGLALQCRLHFGNNKPYKSNKISTHAIEVALTNSDKCSKINQNLKAFLNHPEIRESNILDIIFK